MTTPQGVVGELPFCSFSASNPLPQHMSLWIATVKQAITYLCALGDREPHGSRHCCSFCPLCCHQHLQSAGSSLSTQDILHYYENEWRRVGAEHERNQMFLPLSVCHLNSLKILSIIIARISIARKVLSHDSNSVASRKGLFRTFICEFMSLRGSVTSFSQVTSKFMPLNMSLLCAQEIL